MVFAIDPSIWTTVAIGFGAACLLSVGWPVFITFATDVPGQSKATAVGMMGASNRLGGVVGASAGGAFLAIGGYTAVGIFCLAVVAFSAFVLTLFMREPEPDALLSPGAVIPKYGSKSP